MLLSLASTFLPLYSLIELWELPHLDPVITVCNCYRHSKVEKMKASLEIVVRIK